MSTLVLALLAGAVVGLALGALGGGGGVLAVPALIYLLGFTPVEAATASLVIVTVTSASALYGHARDGRVRWAAGVLFAAAGAGPAALTGALAAGVPRRLLTAGFALVAVLAALRMLRRTADGTADDGDSDGDD
uniref:TSUP family transporter n=1 Tax=Streptomyces sp. TRM64462 TaxID=2741726 RepID=UPI0015863978